jgi:hypothetical protein
MGRVRFVILRGYQVGGHSSARTTVPSPGYHALVGRNVDR